MLFEKLLDGITSILVFLGKALIFLLKVLGLWIPALYSVVFALVCLIFQIAFDEVIVAYFIGLAISVLLSLYVICVKVMKKKERRFVEKNKKREELQQKKEEKKSKKISQNVEEMKQEPYVSPKVGNETRAVDTPQVAGQYDGYVAPNDGGYSRRAQENPNNVTGYDSYLDPKDTRTGFDRDRSENEEADFSQDRADYLHPNLFASPVPQSQTGVIDDYIHPNSLTDNVKQSQGQSGYDGYVAPNQSQAPKNDGYHDYIKPDDSASFAPTPSMDVVKRDYEKVVSGEYRQNEEPFVMPKIFKTRTDENLLIYEYPKRLVFYKRMPTGAWMFVGSEKKPERA